MKPSLLQIHCVDMAKRHRLIDYPGSWLALLWMTVVEIVGRTVTR